MSSTALKEIFGLRSLFFLTVLCVSCPEVGAQDLPDLTPAAMTSPGFAVTEHQVEVTWRVENRGNGEAKAGWYDRLYLSADEVVDGGDRSLANPYWSSVVEAGGEYEQTQTFTVPNVAAGNYYLILRIDVNNGLYEADEGNNELSRPILVTGGEGFEIVEIERMQNGRVRIAFTSMSGMIHQLEQSGAIEEAIWVSESFYDTEDGVEPQDSIEGTGTVLNIYVSPSGKLGFYRMVALSDSWKGGGPGQGRL